MRTHEWKILEGIANLSERLVESVERIADHLTGEKKEDIPVEVKEPIKKIRKSKKPKDNATLPISVSES